MGSSTIPSGDAVTNVKATHSHNSMNMPQQEEAGPEVSTPVMAADQHSDCSTDITDTTSLVSEDISLAEDQESGLECAEEQAIAVSNDDSTPETTLFTLFPKLPVELQLKVYSAAAALTPRYFELKLQSSEDVIFDDYGYHADSFLSMQSHKVEYYNVSDRKAPAILHANGLMREESLKSFEIVPAESTMTARKEIYVNYEIDIFLLLVGGTREDLGGQFSRFTDDLPPREQQKIQRLVIPLPCRNHSWDPNSLLNTRTFNSSANLFQDIRQNLPNLKDLYFFCPGSYTHSDSPVRPPHHYHSPFLWDNPSSDVLHECTYPTVQGSPIVLVDISHWDMGQRSSWKLLQEEFEAEKTLFPDWKIERIIMVALASNKPGVFLSLHVGEVSDVNGTGIYQQVNQTQPIERPSSRGFEPREWAKARHLGAQKMSEYYDRRREMVERGEDPIVGLRDYHINGMTPDEYRDYEKALWEQPVFPDLE